MMRRINLSNTQHKEYLDQKYRSAFKIPAKMFACRGQVIWRGGGGRSQQQKILFKPGPFRLLSSFRVKTYSLQHVLFSLWYDYLGIHTFSFSLSLTQHCQKVCSKSKQLNVTIIEVPQDTNSAIQQLEQQESCSFHPNHQLILNITASALCMML